MPISDFKQSSGIRVHAGQVGELYHERGIIVVGRASLHGIDQNLWAALKIAVDALRVRIHLSSIDTGQHSPHSRHYDGRAADINKVVSVIELGWRQATLLNPQVMQLYNFFRGHGWHVGEGGNWPGLFLGPPRSALNPSDYDHSTHLHVSIARRPVPGGEAWDYSEPEPCDCEADDES